MKLWQCSACREATEDCHNQCQLIMDDDIRPTKCVGSPYRKYKVIVNWIPIDAVDLLHVSGYPLPSVKEQQLYKRAWDVFGQDPQLDMIIEECSELIKEVCKIKRHPDGSYVPILDELVDVSIMIEQFLTVHKIFHGFRRHKRDKLIRLHVKLNSVERKQKEATENAQAEFNDILHKKIREIYLGPQCSAKGKNEEKEVKKDELWVVDSSLHAKRIR